MKNPSLFSTGLAALDNALESYIAPGNFILCAGMTGGGKTILAGQLAVAAAVNDLGVLFVSTEVTQKELESRFVSAHCDIPYDQIMDGMSTIQCVDEGKLTHYPSPDFYGIDATEKSIALSNALSRYYTFTKIKSLNYNPEYVLRDLLVNYECEKGQSPKVVIFDYLSEPSLHRSDIDVFKIREAVEKAASTLKQLAMDKNLLVIAFCQANASMIEEKKILPAHIADFRPIADIADAFVGISHFPCSDVEERGDELIYDQSQIFTVVSRDRPDPVSVSVFCNFAFQRFEPGLIATGGGEDVPSTIKEPAIEFPGYILARRDILTRLFTGQNQNAVNLYVFLLLVADRDGSSFYSRERLTELLGLSSKQLRLAAQYLEEEELISFRRERSRSVQYVIENWEDCQNPSLPGYFKLFRNLRDFVRRDLLADPVLFRTWIYTLSECRATENEHASIKPGEVLVKIRHAEESLRLKEVEFRKQLCALEQCGCIRLLGTLPEKIAVCNWTLYQCNLYRPSRVTERQGKEKTTPQIKDKTGTTQRQRKGSMKAVPGQTEGN